MANGIKTRRRASVLSLVCSLRPPISVKLRENTQRLLKRQVRLLLCFLFVSRGVAVLAVSASTSTMESKPLLEKVEEGAHHHAPDKKSKPVFSKAVKKAANRIINYSPDDLPIDEDASPTAQGCYRLWKRLLVVETVLLLAYLLFPVLERPSWCYYSDCGNHTVVLQSNIWKMPARASQSVELGFVFFFFTMVALQCFAIGTDRFFKQMSSRIEFGVLCFLLVTVIIEMFANSRWLFWSPIIRPIYFVLKHRDARSVFFAIGKSIPAVLPILGILALQIFMFGWIGVLLFIGETDVSE